MADTAIETISGRRFGYDEPRANRVYIPDVAHALGNQCRFAGHTRRFYSVAEHCLNVWSYGAHDFGPYWRLAALLHDAAEAFVVDLPSPLKHRPGMEEYKRVERAAESAILQAVYLSDDDRAAVQMYMHSNSMKTADIAVTLAERNALLNHSRDNPWEYDKLKLTPALLGSWVKDPPIAQQWLRTVEYELTAIRGEWSRS